MLAHPWAFNFIPASLDDQKILNGIWNVTPMLLPPPLISLQATSVSPAQHNNSVTSSQIERWFTKIGLYAILSHRSSGPFIWIWYGCLWYLTCLRQTASLPLFLLAYFNNHHIGTLPCYLKIIPPTFFTCLVWQIWNIFWSFKLLAQWKSRVQWGIITSWEGLQSIPWSTWCHPELATIESSKMMKRHRMSKVHQAMEGMWTIEWQKCVPLNHGRNVYHQMAAMHSWQHTPDDNFHIAHWSCYLYENISTISNA
jgi:hypothetical protein